jgi:hypothetical protein
VPRPTLAPNDSSQDSSPGGGRPAQSERQEPLLQLSLSHPPNPAYVFRQACTTELNVTSLVRININFFLK